MSTSAIHIEHVYKRYQLGSFNTQTFYGDLSKWWASFTGKPDPYHIIGTSNSPNVKDYIWAVNNISLDIEQGDVVGIIGKNGAGKSTLLKIISRITAPTSGQITINGRIASLLEVGTGFHPELSGKDNIYLNGSILGMSKQSIKNKFDEIVDFSGIEKFIDTPVKRYSSGMYVRLAFAVAAHLESEILIIDEILAVGDAEFQKKCLGKMKDLSHSSDKTVLFVSHNIGLIHNLCKTGVLLEKGEVKTTGPINQVVESYSQHEKNDKIIPLADINELENSGIFFKFTRISITAIDDNVTIYEGDTVKMTIWFFNTEPLINVAFGISINDMLGNNLIECRSFSDLPNLDVSLSGEKSISLTFKPQLKANTYSVNIGAIASLGSLDYVPSACTLFISSNNMNEQPWYSNNVGTFMINHKWELNF